MKAINYRILSKRIPVDITAATLTKNASLDIIHIPEEKVIFYDTVSKRYFEATYSEILQAEYHLNRNFVIGGYISVGEWYEFLGLETKESDYFKGWSSYDGYCWIDFNHYVGSTHDGVLYFGIEPIFAPSKFEEDL